MLTEFENGKGPVVLDCRPFFNSGGSVSVVAEQVISLGELLHETQYRNSLRFKESTDCPCVDSGIVELFVEQMLVYG